MTSVNRHSSCRLALAIALGGLSILALSPAAYASARAQADSALCVEKMPPIVDFPDREIGNFEEAAVSGTGAVVAFSSSSQRVGPIGRQRGEQIYAWHRDTGRIELVSRADGAHGQRGNGSASEPAISGDGRYVAFASTASNLINADRNKSQDVFVRDLLLDRTILISSKLGRPNTPADGASSGPSLSGDGSVVAFSTLAADIYGAVKSSTPTSQVVVINLAGQTRTVASRQTGSGAMGNKASFAPSISRDGTRVAFSSFATNLGAGGGYASSVFVFDSPSGSVTWSSWSANAPLPGFISGPGTRGPAISADGTHVAFITRQPDGLYIAPVAGPANLAWPENASFGIAGPSHRPLISGDGAYAVNFANLGNAQGPGMYRFEPGVTPVMVSAGQGAWASRDLTSWASTRKVDGRYGIFDGLASTVPFAWLADPQPTLRVWRPTVKGKTVRLTGRSSYAHTLSLSIGLMVGTDRVRWMSPSGLSPSITRFCPGQLAPNWAVAPARRRWVKTLRKSPPLPSGRWVALVRATSDRGTDVSVSAYDAVKFRVP